MSSTSGLPRGLSSQGTATPSRGSSGTLCSVATGCAGWVKVSGGIATCFLWPTAPITRRNCNWKLILTRRTSQEWEILGKWLAYSICHMDPYGSCVNRFRHVQHLQSFDNLIVITCHHLVLEIGRCQMPKIWPLRWSQKSRIPRQKLRLPKKWPWKQRRIHYPQRRELGWAGWRVHYQSVPFRVGGPSKCTPSAIFQFHFWFISIFISILSYSIFCLSLFIMFHHCPIIFFVVQSLFMKLRMKFQMNLQIKS